MKQGYILIMFAIFAVFSSCEKEENSNLDIPVLTTTTVSTVATTTAICGGNISSDGEAPITARGVCWSTTPTPMVSDNYTNDGDGVGKYTSEMSGLSPETEYYVRAYATNTIGTGYGNVLSFTTEQEKDIPVLTTTTVSTVATTTAICGGNISSDGGASITARGVCWSTTPTPMVSDDNTNDGDGVGDFTSEISGLSPETEYYVRAYATNTVGTGYGNVLSFITEQEQDIPVLTTTTVSTIATTTAICGGNISSDGGAPITARGVCWSTTPTPMVSDDNTNDGDGVGNFTSEMSGLSPETEYYVRAYATNAIGTAYGNVMSFTTEQECALVCNIDAESYSFTISCESGGYSTTFNNESTQYEYGSTGKLIGIKLNLNRTRTYLNTNNTYTIVGVIQVNLVQKTATHNVTVSGGMFANPQTCN